MSRHRAGAITGSLAMFFLAACGTAGESSSAAEAPRSELPSTAASASAASSPSGEAEADLDALIEAAQEEGSLTLYSGFTEEDNNAAAALFTEEYGIEVEIFRANTNEVLTRYAQEADAGVVGADVLALADVTASATLQDQGLLMEYVPPSAEEAEYGEEYRGTHYHVAGITLWPAVWNTEVVENAPTDFEDFLDEQWAGRMGLLDASTSLVGLQYYYILRETLGVEFMEQLGAQSFRFLSPNNAIAEQIVSGELSGAPVLTLNVAQQFQEAGAPMEAGYMESGTPVLTRTVQIPSQPQNPNAAKLFVHFLLTQEGQQGFQATAKSLSPRSDVTVEGLPDPESFTPLALEDPQDFLDRQTELQEEFTTLFKGTN